MRVEVLMAESVRPTPYTHSTFMALSGAPFESEPGDVGHPFSGFLRTTTTLMEFRVERPDEEPLVVRVKAADILHSIMFLEEGLRGVALEGGGDAGI